MLIGTDPRFVRNPSDGGDGWGDSPETPGVDESANDDYGDLRLRVDSPARDEGDNSLLPADTFDLDCDGDVSERLPGRFGRKSSDSQRHGRYGGLRIHSADIAWGFEW